MSKAQKVAAVIADDEAKGIVRSDRAIAKKTGASHTAVQNVRKATGNQLPVDNRGPRVGDITEAPRVGLDGKQRRMPVRQPIIDDEDDDYDPDVAIEQTKQALTVIQRTISILSELLYSNNFRFVEIDRIMALAGGGVNKRQYVYR